MKSKRPQDLVFTLYGEYLLDRKAPVWVGSLIALLRPFRLTEGAVRTVLSRMTRKGWLGTRRSGRNSYYDLTRRGHRLLEEGRNRIYHPAWGEEWDGRWYLLSYSIPEDVRHLRDRLRIRLAWLGFGSLGNGIWISPHDVENRVVDMAREMGIEGRLLSFRAHQLGSDDPQELARRSWDLPGLAARYEAFLKRWKPALAHYRAVWSNGRDPDERCYVDRFHLIHEFRRFPLEDPYLPTALLPDGWPGRRAASVFNELHDLLEPPAERYVASVLSAAPRPVARRAAGAAAARGRR